MHGFKHENLGKFVGFSVENLELVFLDFDHELGRGIENKSYIEFMMLWAVVIFEKFRNLGMWAWG